MVRWDTMGADVRGNGWVLAILLGMGCPSVDSVIPEYEAAREAALGEPAPLVGQWEPDVVLHLGARLVDDVIGDVMVARGRIGQKDVPALGGAARLSPDLMTERVKVRSSNSCDACLAVDIRLAGDLGFRIGPVKGKVPIQVDVGLDIRVESRRDVDDQVVVANFHALRSAKARPTGRRLPKKLEAKADAAVEQVLRTALPKHLDDLELTRIDAATLPVRAMRVAPSELGIRVDMASRAVEPKPVGSVQAKVLEEWKVVASQGSLLSLARRVSFEKGPGEWSVVPEPTSLTIDRKSFELGLRLWMTTGSGWWRDYRVTGSVETQEGSVRLRASDVEALGSSPGAAIVDPLAALGESSILDSIASALDASVPTRHGKALKGLVAEVGVTSVFGADANLVVRGTLTTRPAKRGGSR